MRSADLPPSYRAYRLVILALTAAATGAGTAWSVRAGLPQGAQRWAAQLLETFWAVWTALD
ncbi:MULTISPECIES: hypothetical protein [unclassified Micromonospora]|uniref:hypothetical protein n=1 Tax=unclassified Micromonospora TaxID=2617518 RepID=UPI0033D41A9E